MSVPKFRQNFSKLSLTTTQLTQTTGLYTFGPFRLSENERLLFCGESEVRLKSKDLDLLLVLLKNRSRLVTKAELMEEVWPNSYVAEANLGVHIACLRKALRKHSPGHPYIETVHKYGYRFVEKVIEKSEETPVKIEAPDELVNYVRESLMACPEAVLSLAGGLRIEARKSASGTEVTMMIPKTAESMERSEIALRRWSLQKDGVTITSTLLDGTSCVRILFKDT